MSRAYPDNHKNNNQNKQSPANQGGFQAGFNDKGEPQLVVDGFSQILEMLKVADPAFRESLLRRLAARDRQLAADLRADLNR